MPGVPRELLKHILRQHLQDHPNGEVGLARLVAFLGHIGEVEVELADMGEADIAGAEQRGEARVVVGAEVERDFAVEEADGDGMELFGDEADVDEVGGAGDLGRWRLCVSGRELRDHPAGVGAGGIASGAIF